MRHPWTFPEKEQVLAGQGGSGAPIHKGEVHQSLYLGWPCCYRHLSVALLLTKVLSANSQPHLHAVNNEEKKKKKLKKKK